MSTWDGWRVSLPVRTHDLAGNPTTVAVGLVEVGPNLEVGICVDDGETVLLPDDLDIQLSVKLRQAISEKLKWRG